MSRIVYVCRCRPTRFNSDFFGWHYSRIDRHWLRMHVSQMMSFKVRSSRQQTQFISIRTQRGGVTFKRTLNSR